MDDFPNDLVSPNEAAQLVGTSPHTIRRWAKAGTLPAFKLGGRLRVSKADALAMLKRVEAPGKPMLTTRAEATAKARRVDEILREAGIRK